MRGIRVMVLRLSHHLPHRASSSRTPIIVQVLHRGLFGQHVHALVGGVAVERALAREPKQFGVRVRYGLFGGITALLSETL